MNWQQWAMFGLGAWLGAVLGFVACALMVANKQGDEVTHCIECHAAQQQEREAFRRHLDGEKLRPSSVTWQELTMLAGSEGENLPRSTEAECAMSMRGRGVR